MLEEDFLKFESRRLGLPSAEDEETNEGVEILTNANVATCSSPVGDVVEFLPMLSPINELPSGSYRPRVRLKCLPQPVLETPPTEAKVGTQVLTVKAVKVFKYVDDNISVDKVNFGTTDAVKVGEEMIKFKLAVNLQNAFRSITRKAEEMGMVINGSKTTLLTILDALHHRPKAYILDNNNTRIDSVTSMSVLGFRLSDRPTVSAHVDYVVKALRRRYWTLFHLCKVGFNEEELVRVYRSMLLPIADYCCPAYHSMLTDIQDQTLERTQVGALRATFGYGANANQLRQSAGVETLRARRIRLTDNFARKCLENQRFKTWFPENEERRGRQGEKYKEFFAKNDRLMNSPLSYMRRRLNGKEGKKYGERNKRYGKRRKGKILTLTIDRVNQRLEFLAIIYPVP